MNSPKTLKKSPIPNNDLAAQLNHLGLLVTAQGLDDLLARASTQRWSPRQLLEEIARSETVRPRPPQPRTPPRPGPPRPLQTPGRLRMALAPENRPPLDRTRPHPGLPHLRPQL